MHFLPSSLSPSPRQVEVSTLDEKSTCVVIPPFSSAGSSPLACSYSSSSTAVTRLQDPQLTAFFFSFCLFTDILSRFWKMLVGYREFKAKCGGALQVALPSEHHWICCLKTGIQVKCPGFCLSLNHISSVLTGENIWWIWKPSLQDFRRRKLKVLLKDPGSKSLLNFSQ